jgi:excisionase family DNA binding protein
MIDTFTEAEAAKKLGISKTTLVRERMAGRIRAIRMGQRIIRYTEEILDEYLRQCANDPDKSATTGSASGQARTRGAERGSTPQLDKHAAHLLALRTFKKAS